jgi:tRNA A37 methylthiotransferase MiaB
VLVEAVDEETGEVTGRADHQAPETDGQVVLVSGGWQPQPGTFVTAKVTGAQGVDLVAEPLGGAASVGAPAGPPAGAATAGPAVVGR